VAMQAFEKMRISAYAGSLMETCRLKRGRLINLPRGMASRQLTVTDGQVENLRHTPACACSKKLDVGCVQRFRADTPAVRPALPIERRLEAAISTAGVSSPKRARHTLQLLLCGRLKTYPTKPQVGKPTPHTCLRVFEEVRRRVCPALSRRHTGSAACTADRPSIGNSHLNRRCVVAERARHTLQLLLCGRLKTYPTCSLAILEEVRCRPASRG